MLLIVAGVVAGVVVCVVFSLPTGRQPDGEDVGLCFQIRLEFQENQDRTKN